LGAFTITLLLTVILGILVSFNDEIIISMTQKKSWLGETFE
jgi:hypothetical protein